MDDIRATVWIEKAYKLIYRRQIKIVDELLNQNLETYEYECLPEDFVQKLFNADSYRAKAFYNDFPNDICRNVKKYFPEFQYSEELTELTELKNILCDMSSYRYTIEGEKELERALFDDNGARFKKFFSKIAGGIEN